MTVVDADAKYIGVPDELIKSALSDLTEWRIVGERMLERAIATCPVGKTDDLGSAPTQSSNQTLKQSMEVRFQHGPDASIQVGSKLTRGDQQLSALDLIESGTVAHPIATTNAKALRFTQGGSVVFYNNVQHPGTPANKFVEAAIRAVILEGVVV